MKKQALALLDVLIEKGLNEDVKTAFENNELLYCKQLKVLGSNTGLLCSLKDNSELELIVRTIEEKLNMLVYYVVLTDAPKGRFLTLFYVGTNTEVYEADFESIEQGFLFNYVYRMDEDWGRDEFVYISFKKSCFVEPS